MRKTPERITQLLAFIKFADGSGPEDHWSDLLKACDLEKVELFDVNPEHAAAHQADRREVFDRVREALTKIVRAVEEETHGVLIETELRRSDLLLLEHEP